MRISSRRAPAVCVVTWLGCGALLITIAAAARGASPLPAQEDSGSVTAASAPGQADTNRPSASVAAPTKEQDRTGSAARFVRLKTDEQGQPEALQTAIVRLAKPGADAEKECVDLVAAIHIGDKPYYEALNQEFAKYDAVLYELVARPGTIITKGGGSRSTHPIGVVQRFFKDALGLELQLDYVDYTAANFVHADMSPEQLSRAMADRNESVFTILMRLMAAGMSDPNAQISDADLLMALLSPDRALALKRLMAQQLQHLESTMHVLEGENGSSLIADRNKVAIGVLREQLAAGKKRVAIFYGGGHMEDMQKRIGEEFGLKPVSTRWLDAWDLKPKSRGDEPESPAPAAETPVRVRAN